MASQTSNCTSPHDSSRPSGAFCLSVLLAAIASGSLLLGCADDEAGPFGDGGTSSQQGGSGGTAGTGMGGGGDGGAGGAGEPRIEIRIAAHTDAFAHADGLAGQTALTASGGVRSLSLYRDESDTDPWVLFDVGSNPIEVGYDDGDDTVVATVPSSTLVAGTYTVGRLSQSYSRYQVAATLHTASSLVEGLVDNVLVMSDGTMLDGQTRDGGYYLFSFAGGADSFSLTGDDFPVPIYSFTAGATAVVEQGEWAVYFPVDVTIPDDTTADLDVTVDVNMHEAFRWTDLAVLGYELGVFDITTVTYEPVVRFGGNQFELTVSTSGN